VQGCTHGQSGVGIDGAVALFDELDDALLVDDDVGAQSPLVGFVLHVVTLQDAVGLEHLAVHVAEEREVDANLLGEGSVGGGTIQTNSENFGVRGVNPTGGDASLDRLKLLRSTAGEGEDVDGEEDVFLAAVVAELDGFPLIAEKSEIRGGIADFESHFGDFGLTGMRRNGSRGESCGNQKSDGDLAFHGQSPIRTGMQVARRAYTLLFV
jgi:hypothetical protein